ncbi:hypothetical protein LCGC14_1123530 [marine sediment metagenome]|uniref:Phosphoadenosine phosphosulphate reductase domain-containing protein n=1 Tax=marine sediment metagenome TaxID=412755 RepID=A0A0F9PLH0_9ZZZZ
MTTGGRPMSYAYKRHQLTEDDRERMVDCVIVASMSGGKDSGAMSLWFTEQGIEHDRVFSDTGWEHPNTIAYLDGPLREKVGTITRVAGERGMAELSRHKGMFPSRLRRFCTEELKIKPIKRHLDTYDCEVVNAVGIRAAESKARAKMPRWEPWPAGDCDVWRPLIAWTEQDVIDIHAEHGLVPNPLYLRGAKRVGCWPCIFSRKEEIAMVAEQTPWRIDEIRQLEKDVGDVAEKRYAKRGETFESLGYNRPTMFHDRGRRMTPIPIDEVVAWSKTARGGRQLMLLNVEPPGCVRWGLCESSDLSEAP